MSYTLQAFIGDFSELEQKLPSGLTVVSLDQGKALIPLTDEVREVYEIPFLPLTNEDQVEIAPSIKAIAERFKGPIAYIEAEFFGGDGTQASAIWKGHKLIFGPVVNASAINDALWRLGVVKDGHHDEFDALALGTHRDTNDWARSQSKS